MENLKLEPDSLIFDMDGTLWDAVDTYAKCWNEALRRMGISRTLSREELSRYMGMEITEIMRRSVTGLTEEQMKTLYRLVFEIQDEYMPIWGGTLYPGVKEGIHRLASRYKILMLSNSEKNGIKNFLQYTGLGDYITDSVTFGDNYRHKAKNMRLLQEKNDLQAPVYIGDTDGDRKQTEEAGFPFIFVRYGFGRTDRYALAFDDFRSLTDYFMNL